MALALQPSCKLHTSCNRGLLQAFQRCSISSHPRRPQTLSVQGKVVALCNTFVYYRHAMQLLTLMCRAASGRTCQLTGKKANNGYVVTFSHKRNKKLQHINLQEKKVYWPEGSRWVKLRVCTKVSRPQAVSAPLVLAATYPYWSKNSLLVSLLV